MAENLPVDPGSAALGGAIGVAAKAGLDFLLRRRGQDISGEEALRAELWAEIGKLRDELNLVHAEAEAEVRAARQEAAHWQQLYLEQFKQAAMLEGKVLRLEAELVGLRRRFDAAELPAPGGAAGPLEGR